MPRKKQKYQNLIYVVVEQDGDSEAYFTSFSDPAEVVDNYGDAEIGIYKFVKTAKVRTKIEVV